MKHIISGCLAILFLGLISSCEKQESIIQLDDTALTEDCFFNNECLSLTQPKSAKKKSELKLTKAVKQWFKKDEDQKKKFKKKVGVPVWKENYSFESETHEVVYIPVVQKNEEQTNGILIAARKKGGSKIKYRTIKRKHLSKYKPLKEIANIGKELSAEHLIIQFLLFDKDLFGITDCGLVKLLKKKEEGKSCQFEQVITDWWQIDSNGENLTYLGPTTSYEFVCNDDNPLDRDFYENEDSSGVGPSDPYDGGGSSGTPTVTDPCADGYTGGLLCLDRPIGGDCESWEYVEDYNSNWQIAAVENISFRLLYGMPFTGQTPKYYSFVFERPVYFGIPSKTHDNRIIHPLEASQRSAEAYAYASELIYEYYEEYEQRPVDTEVEQQFKELMEEYLKNWEGGRVTLQAQSSKPIQITQFKTTFWGEGNCW